MGRFSRDDKWTSTVNPPILGMSDDEEIKANPRARSARLRVAERIEEGK